MLGKEPEEGVMSCPTETRGASWSRRHLSGACGIEQDSPEEKTSLTRRRPEQKPVGDQEGSSLVGISSREAAVEMSYKGGLEPFPSWGRHTVHARAGVPRGWASAAA